MKDNDMAELGAAGDSQTNDVPERQINSQPPGPVASHNSQQAHNDNGGHGLDVFNGVQPEETPMPTGLAPGRITKSLDDLHNDIAKSVPYLSNHPRDDLMERDPPRILIMAAVGFYHYVLCSDLFATIQRFEKLTHDYDQLEASRPVTPTPTPTTDTFPQFAHFPVEIALLVWEAAAQPPPCKHFFDSVERRSRLHKRRDFGVAVQRCTTLTPTSPHTAAMPYITSTSTPEPTPEQRAAAEALIAQEHSTVPDDPHHALLRPAYESNLTPAMQAEVARVAANHSVDAKADKKKQTQLSAIDLSRYEVDDVDDEEAEGGDAVALRARLARAYTRQTYLRGRRAHLALLDSYGKNAWLVGNWQTEADLRALEADLADTRREVDFVTLRRQRAQNEAAGELRSLDETWRTGVGRVLETEAAAEELRLQILDARRQRAENGEESV